MKQTILQKIKTVSFYILFLAVASCDACSCDLSDVKGGVVDAKLSGDGQYAVFTSYRCDLFIFCTDSGVVLDEIYSINTSTGKLVDLGFDSQADFEILSDNQTVIIRSGFKLYRTTVAGGDATLIADNVTIEKFRISFDEQTIVYQSRNAPKKLYSVPIAGGEPVFLSEEIGTESFKISPDASYVIFTNEAYEGNPWTLYHVPTSGGSITELAVSESFENKELDDFVISEDSDWIVLRGDLDGDATLRLYSIFEDDGMVTTLSNNLDPNSSLGVSKFLVSRDSQTVVYSGDTEYNGIERLFAVPIGGGTSTLLSDNTAIDDVESVVDFAITSDDSTVVYSTSGPSSLNAVSMAGGAILELELDEVYQIHDIQISPNDSHVLWTTGNANSAFASDIHLIPIAGGTKIDLTNTDDITQYHFSEDGTRVFYSTLTEVYSFTISDETSVLLSQQEPKDEVSGFVSSADGSFVLFWGHLNHENNSDLFSNTAQGDDLKKLYGF